MNKLREFLNHERYQSIAVLLCAGLLLWFYGCDSKVASLVKADKQVTRGELNLEVQSLQGLANLRYDELDRQDLFKRTFIEQLLIVGQSGAVSPYGIMTMLIGTLGIGATVDNVRKRVEIKKLKNGK